MSNLLAFNPITALTGEQRRTAEFLMGSDHSGWVYRITPSTGPAQHFELVHWTGRAFTIERDGLISDAREPAPDLQVVDMRVRKRASDAEAA
jgi:hypothetical protein